MGCVYTFSRFESLLVQVLIPLDNISFVALMNKNPHLPLKIYNLLFWFKIIFLFSGKKASMSFKFFKILTLCNFVYFVLSFVSTFMTCDVTHHSCQCGCWDLCLWMSMGMVHRSHTKSWRSKLDFQLAIVIFMSFVRSIY